VHTRARTRVEDAPDAVIECGRLEVEKIARPAKEQAHGQVFVLAQAAI
jgi:hypothetical protein